MTQREPKSLVAQLGDAHREIERLRAERDLWQSRCVGALWLVPEDKTCGELQEAARQARRLLNEQTGKAQSGEQ